MLYYLTAMTPSSSHLSYPSCFDFTICVSIHSITMHDPHNFRASINRLKGNVEFHIFCSYSGRMSCRDCFSPSCPQHLHSSSYDKYNPYHSDLVAVPSYLVSLILCLL
eukprot:44678_1